MPESRILPSTPMAKKRKHSILDYLPEEAALFEPRSDYDRAIIGITKCGRVIYSEADLIEIIMNNDAEVDLEMAKDFIDYNMVSGASTADFPPIIQQDI